MGEDGRGRHRARRIGELPELLRSWRRRAANALVRATGSKPAAVIAFLILAIAAWIVADVIVGEDTRRTDRHSASTSPGSSLPPPLPPNEPALVAAAGPTAEMPVAPTPAPTSGATPPAPQAPPPSAYPNTPPPQPAPPPAQPAQPAPKVAYAKQYTLMVRSAPTQRADLIATLPNNTPVTVVCHTTGPSVVSFTGRTTTTWDKIITPEGATGYVSDGWLLTEDDITRLVPAC
ncbi:SH3 domain-containing protein [Yinghuangia sp. YIM S10712]|uniref:SH3 domain-containing protein n=1 Tax=Yinghuangia sp. YIM S10712 TaxID=3436930 RepID=UPI003F5343C1